jgi:hypothetical protein
MSDTIKIETKQDLKDLIIPGTSLRFVVENKAWYYSDPTSTAIADNENILAPTVGSGRWFKSTSNVKNIQATSVVVHNLSNITMSPGVHYIVDMTLATDNCELTLPVSGALGDFVQVSLLAPSNIYRLIIKKGVNTINQVSTDYAFLRKSVIARFDFAGNSNWIIDNPGVFKYTLAPYFAAPSTTDVAQNGIVDYLGRNYGVNPTYTNPGVVAAGFTQKMNIVAHRLYAQTGTRFNVFEKTPITTTFAGVNTIAGEYRPFAVIFYETGTNTPLPVRLDSVYIEYLTSLINDTSRNPPTIEVYGVQEPFKHSWVQAMTDQAQASAVNTFLLYEDTGALLKESPTRKHITSIDAASIPLTEGFYWSVPFDNARFLPINSTEFFPIYYFLGFDNFNTNGTGFALNQLEFYGDIII